MKKLLTLCLLLAACGEKQHPQTVNFSNDTIKGNWYYDSTSNTLRVKKDAVKPSRLVKQSRIITRRGNTRYVASKKYYRFDNALNATPASATTSRATNFIVDTKQPGVSTFASLLIQQPVDSFVHAGSNRNRIYIADTVYTKYYMVLILGHHGYAAYQRCDTCRLVVLDSAATINALFYLLNRQFKTKQ